MLKREELDEIALKVAVQVAVDMWPYESHLESELTNSDREYYGKFAHALLCKVQKRLEVVATVNLMKSSISTNYLTKLFDGETKLTTLPLIEE